MLCMGPDFLWLQPLLSDHNAGIAAVRAAVLAARPSPCPSDHPWHVPPRCWPTSPNRSVVRSRCAQRPRFAVVRSSHRACPSESQRG
jgi:hypothetical protein